MKKLIELLGIAILFSCCATAYQSKGLMGGHSETQLGANIFQISFRGNAYTSNELAADFCLLRSAEVALENGFQYFIIVEADKTSKISSYTTPKTTQTTGSVRISGNIATGQATSYTTGGQTYHYSRPRTTNMILCFKDKPESEGLVFDAKFVRQAIRKKYLIN
jgi:hypothetical protein